MLRLLKIALAVHPNGEWSAYGSDSASEPEMQDVADDFMPRGSIMRWVEVEVDFPEEEVEKVQGVVKEA